MEKGFIEKVNLTVDKKVHKIDKKFLNYAVRAMMAGALLALIYAFVTQMYSDFTKVESAMNPLGVPLGKLSMSYLFGIGLIFIIYFGAELFTSNAMYFAIGLGNKRVTLSKTVQVMATCWFFNLIGAFIMSFFIVQSGLFTITDGSSANPFIFELAAKKASLPANEIFFRAILANFVVNLVVYVALVVKEDIAKLFIIPLGLVPFVYLGFEHSIANFGVFWTTILTHGSDALAVYHGHAFTIGAAANNLLFATLGNIVGGAICVGGYFVFLHRKSAE